MSGGDEHGCSAYPKSIQAGIPKINNPAGWPTPKIGALLKVVQRPVRLEKTKEYRLVTARRSRGGIVRRETLLGKDIATPSQFEIAEGDFLISRRQIAHGACGIVPAELTGSVVSNEYATLRPTAALDPGFLKHLTSSIYFQQTCFHSSIGVHVEKLVFDLQGWLRWPIAVPEPPEQRRIAAVLDAWDDAIISCEKLIAAKERRRSLAIDELLGLDRTTGAENPDWDDIKLSEIFELRIGGTPSRRRPDYWDSDLETENHWVSIADLREREIYSTKERLTPKGIASSNVKLIPKNTLLMSFKLTLGRVSINQVPVFTNEAIVALIPKRRCSLTYFETLLGRLDFSAQAEQAIKGLTLNKAKLSELIVTVPPYEVQLELGAQLDVLRSDLEYERQHLTLLRKQKRGLMQKLLTGQRRVPESIDTLLPAANEVAA